MAAAVPPPGALYANPPVPAEFAADPTVATWAPAAAVLSTCYAVTTGPDRNLYWVYSHMPMSATAIPTPVTPACCFETFESIAVSQGKNRPMQKCITCRATLQRHMTNAQATTAFTAHAAAHPATHTTLNAAVAPGVTAPAGYATTNGFTAPIVATVVVPLPGPPGAPPPPPGPDGLPPPPAPDGAPPAAPDGPPGQRAPAIPSIPPGLGLTGPNIPSLPPPTDQYKLLTDMVKINPSMIWSDDQEAHRFLVGLESILEFSPVVPAHWITLIMMMIPGKFELERTWVRNNIMTPLISWNAAKVAFTNHFQRGDYLDGRRLLYSQCTQSQNETTQEYTRRFQTLADQLGYPDGDQQSVYRYIDGLHHIIQQKLVQHKLTMRAVGNAPFWDFRSLNTTSTLAITMGTEPIYSQRTTPTTSLPLHLRKSALANPPCRPTTTTTSTTESHNPTQSTTRESNRKRKPQPSPTSEERKCQFHPNSKTHSTEECRTKGKSQRSSSPPNADVTSKPSRPNTRSQDGQPTTRPAATTTSSSAPVADSPRVQCFRCHQYGHVMRNCPQAPSTTTNTNPNPRQNNKSPQSQRKAARRVQIDSKDEDDDQETAPTTTPSKVKSAIVKAANEK
jgi:hypothetical protein